MRSLLIFGILLLTVCTSLNALPTYRYYVYRYPRSIHMTQRDSSSSESPFVSVRIALPNVGVDEDDDYVSNETKNSTQKHCRPSDCKKEPCDEHLENVHEYREYIRLVNCQLSKSSLDQWLKCLWKILAPFWIFALFLIGISKWPYFE